MPHWYRAWARVESRQAQFDMDGEFLRFLNVPEPEVTIYFDELEVLKTTPCGVWLDVDGSRRFVLRDARKRYACPTKEEAIESLQARQGRRKSILEEQLRDVTDVLEALKCPNFKQKSASETSKTYRLSLI